MGAYLQILHICDRAWFQRIPAAALITIQHCALLKKIIAKNRMNSDRYEPDLYDETIIIKNFHLRRKL